ncbi:MAG: hypothetical protein HY906_04750, partial [Deltaproteobacteria bacterium]|nr:hypothetical protein [Deltaproteobacteria bacterium]
GSIGILVSLSGAVAAGPTLTGNRIQRGLGGVGGNGGFGGAGGQGGAGGFGGRQARWSSSVGGKGGEGGNGGPGGGGGGGAGGPSFSVLGFNLPVAGYAATNTFLTSAAVNTGGVGGQGGSSPGGTSTGTPGAPGASADLQTLSACGPGNTCALGFTCDANQVCVPN